MQKIICPVCNLPVFLPNRLVKWHVRYKPPIVILGCKYCNWIEFLIRHKKDITDPVRNIAVKRYMLKFDIIL